MDQRYDLPSCHNFTREALPKCTVMPDKNYTTHKNDTLCNDNRCMVEQIIRAIYELDRTFH